MTRKDYALVAGTLKNALDEIAENTGADDGGEAEFSTVHYLSVELADAFRKDNPRFRPGTFLEACECPKDMWPADIN